MKKFYRIGEKLSQIEICGNDIKNYSIAEDEDEDGKTYLTFACSCGSMLDNEECTAWRIISEVLIGMPGAPLKQALMDAGIGQDIYGGFEDHLLTPAFIIVAKNIARTSARFAESRN